MNATMERTREMKEAWMEEHQGGWCDGTPAAEGLYKGAKVINVFVGLGMRRRKFQSQEIEEVDLVVVRLGWRDRAGEPYRYETGPMKISSSPRSALCRFLRELLGREVRGIVRPEGLRKLKGMPCQVTVVRITVSEERRCMGLAEVAKRVGCHKFHLSAVLHGRRKASDKLRRDLLALGIAETADGERI